MGLFWSLLVVMDDMQACIHMADSHEALSASAESRHTEVFSENSGYCITRATPRQHLQYMGRRYTRLCADSDMP